MVYSCAPVLENSPGFTHTAALMIGDSKENVVSQAEHIFNKPKTIGYGLKGTPDEFEIRRYKFFADADVLLYFYKGIFFQANLIEPNSITYPVPRQDYKELRKDTEGIAGYLLTLQGKVGLMKAIKANEKNKK